MVSVKKIPGQSDDQLIKNFTRQVVISGIVNEAKRRKFHLKPSLARKAKKKERQLTRALIARGL
jgi:ribosomal protein S21